MTSVIDNTSIKMTTEHKENDLFDIETNPYVEPPWDIIESYFKGQQLERFVRHQLESYNNFIGYQIIKTIDMFNPVHIASEQDFDDTSNKYALEIFITFENFNIYRAQIHENNGAIKLMFPQEARLRNFTYSASTTIDINIKYVVRTGETLENVQTFHKTIPHVYIGKLPIMLKSNICVLSQYKHFDTDQTGECKFDAGGYFIINGSEKTVLGQERAAENRVYCFNIEKNDTKYLWKAEIKSVPDFKCISPKQISMYISSKNNGFGYPIVIELPRIKQPIPLFIVFRALGVMSDKDICEKILLNIGEDNKKFLEALQASIIEADKYLTQEDCVKHITSYAMYTPINMDKETGAKKKHEFTLDILNNDLFPHCHIMEQKIYFMGYMANRLLMAYFELIKADDRDSYLNKRIDLTGTLLNNLYRNYFNKLVKDMEKQIIREINTGSWRSKDNFENIINMTNIYKIIKATTIENGIKRALSTGDFGTKHNNTNKVGVAQVYNRLNYVSSLSHSRRISTPVDKSGKLIPPRKLHNTSWGYLCLTGDTEILMSDRITIKKIKDMKDGDKVITVNPETLLDEPSDIHSFFSKMPDKLFKITTISGRTIKATANHPFLVNNNGKPEWKNLEDLKLNDKMIIRHMVKNIDDEITTCVMINDTSVLEHYKMDLLELNLLNTNIPVYKLKIIARLLGSLNTDGHLQEKTEKNKKYYCASFYLGEENDVFQMSDDVVNLGFGSVSVKRKITKFEDKISGRNTQYRTWEVSLNGSFAYLLFLMGGIIGKKTEAVRVIPQWLTNAELSIKREFISAFQGGDGSRLSYQKNDKTWKPHIGITFQTTHNEYLESTVKYMTQIANMFIDFGIKSNIKTSIVDETKSKVCIVFENSSENLAKYSDTINYTYCEEKRKASAPIVEHLKIKEFNKIKRDLNYKYVINNCKKVSIEELINKTNFTENQIKKVISKNKKGVCQTTRFTTDVIYETYLKENIMNNGCISVPILEIVEIEPELVYDFTTRSDNHSFVASSFVTHNCPAETPEGQSVGVVKNISYMTHITIYSNSGPLYEYIMPNIVKIEDASLTPAFIYDKVKVFINGVWVGISLNPEELYLNLKDKKYKGIINIYTSIIFNYKLKEIRICNDGGRLTRPLLRAKNKNILINTFILDKLKNGEYVWDNLLTSSVLNESVLEYIDPEEQSWSVIATKPKDMVNPDNKLYKYTHCEIHPSTIFGVLASCIPFPEHNQSPRNTYQCAQGKQAMGVYVSNYENRMDKTAYVLNYPMKPLVDTRIMNLIHLNKIPSGSQLIVAIMTHTGYNQEDSLLINQGSIDRGMSLTTIYHTEKDEDKQKINGDDEIRCKPDSTKTKGMKMANYNKVNSKGVIPENTLVENRDVIIAKIIPIKENRNDHTKVIKYEDQSKIYKTIEETYIDKNYIDRNGEGYKFAKVRLRTLRKPVIGDKFCALPTQQVLTDKGWMEIQYIDIALHKVATLDINGHLCYEYPTAKFEYDHNDKMYSIKNKQVEIVCTLNHRLYVKTRSSKAYELMEAKNVMGKMVRFKKSMENTFADVEYIQLDNDVQYKMDDWLPLLGMFIADGYCHNNTVYITALKERKIDYNKQLLEKLNINYTYSNDGKFIIYGTKYPELASALSILSVGALNKYLPDYVWNLSQSQSRILLSALLQGDGSSMEYKGETFDRYGTISVQLANDITRLALHCGYSGIVKIAEEPTGIARVGVRNLGSRAGQVVEITQQHTYYKVSIITKQNEPWINKKVNDSNEEKLIDYEGKVYCVEMPSSHTYYMRETTNSPCLIVGNSSRHGQKGTVGNIIPEHDIPYTAEGIRPDIIINPHAIPSRMTIGQLKETVLGKVLIELGLFGDGTSFGNFELADICDLLLKAGCEAHGNELMYDALTGEQVEYSVFMGPVFYQRLKHMVNDKSHSRSIGPMVNLTRQPAEGRSRDGGLRFGEMERDCFSQDTQIVTTNGLSVMIKNMENCDHEVLGWDAKTNTMVPSKQTGFLYKGERECVKLTFEDGRTNICTPDHPILTSNNQWIKAKDLVVNKDKVKTSITCPVVDFNDEINECNGWSLKVGDLIFKTDTVNNYKKTLVLAKLIGYLITDGHIGKLNYNKNKDKYTACVYLGHMIDVNSFLNDLSLLCNITQDKFNCNNLYLVRIPYPLLNHIVKLKGLIIGRKVVQSATLPDFIMDENCPKPIVREFLGSIFGGDGHTCVLGMHRGKRDILTSISFSQTKNKLHLESLTQMMSDIKKLLARFDINKVTIQNFKETSHSKGKHSEDDKLKNYQLTLHLDIDELIPFSEKIGFRYCCHKSQRLEAGVSYKRLRNEVARQHNWIVEKVDELTKFSEIKKETPDKIVSTKNAIKQAVAELGLTEPLIHSYAIPSTHDITDHLVKGTKFGKFTSSAFPTAEEYLKEIGALDWFLATEKELFDDKIYELLDKEEGVKLTEGVLDEENEMNNSSACYGVKRECDGLPTMNLKIIDIRPAGIRKVYDIEVENTHSFLANGIVAHNCMVSHGAARFTRGRMYDASDKYSVYVCKTCGLIASYNDKMHIHLCRTCGNRADFAYVEIPYACKLLFQELNTMNIAPRMITEG